MIPQDRLSQLRVAASDMVGLSSAGSSGPRMGPSGPSLMFQNVRAACTLAESSTESLSLPRKLLQEAGPSTSAAAPVTPPDAVTTADTASTSAPLPEIGGGDNGDGGGDDERKWIRRIAVAGGLCELLPPLSSWHLPQHHTSAGGVHLRCVGIRYCMGCACSVL